MSDAKNPKAGGLLARLFGVQDDENADTPPEAKSEPSPPPVPEQSAGSAGASEPPNGGTVVVVSTERIVVTEGPGEPMPPTAEPEASEVVTEPAAEQAVTVEEVPAPAPVVPVAPAAPQACSACGTPRQGESTFCHDCGWMFPVGGAATSSSATPLRETDMAANIAGRLQGRYELTTLTGERDGVQRFRGVDHTTGQAVVVVAAPVAEAILEAAPVADIVEDDIMPGFDDDIPLATPVNVGAAWPSIAWEKNFLEKASHPALPKVLDQFTTDNTEYLVLEVPVGMSLWDAWDEPDTDAGVRYGWLQKIAAGLEAIHKAGALFEGFRPDVVVIGEMGQPRITDLGDILPVPVPPNAPIKATLYTAPELILSPTSADTRSDLYSFGALLYSLEYLHHPLEEKDFERQFTPYQITERFPDVHPLFLRLINKTFCRDIHSRFPTDEMTKTDPSGFGELMKTLAVAGRAFDDVRLDIAAWTTTGMVRTGNEDALSVLHGVDTRQDDVGEYAMILLCDGMGGYDAGEVAAAMAINEMRKYLLAQPMFAALTGREGPKEPVDVKKYQEILRDALKHANKEVYTAGRTPGRGKRGMGCTAECVYVDSRNVIAGHVGDSRVYHLHKGRLIQLTRDQTLVNRLVELGQLTAAEAEDHPRKNELQQAIGGQPDVNPGTYAGKLQRGDWVLVCSDGLTNHINHKELESMLTREAANSAEEAARRLLNLVNLRGATDNATIVVVRAS